MAGLFPRSFMGTVFDSHAVPPYDIVEEFPLLSAECNMEVMTNEGAAIFYSVKR